ncbi:MAG: cytochrome c, partial [Dehalococcoidia bacterium]
DGTSGLGPTLQGIAAGAGNRVSGLNGEEYIRQSILDPNSFVVGGFPPGIMPANFAETLSSQDIDNLVAFLLTQ